MMKSSEDGAAGRKARGFPWGALGRFLFGDVRRFLFILLVLVVLVLWQVVAFGRVYVDAFNRTYEALGWGFLLIALALAALVWVVWRGHLRSLFKHGNRWLGAFAWWLAAWGILGFLPGEGILAKASLGGTFGREIVLGSADVWGGLRVFGLLLGGFILFFPRPSRTVAGKLSKLLRRLYHKYPLHLPFATWLRLFIAEVRLLWGRIAGGVAGVFKHDAPDKPEADKTKAKPQRTKVAAAQPAAVSSPATPAASVTAVPLTSNRVSGRWSLPPMSVLDPETVFEFGQADNQKRAKLIEQALSSYGVDASVVQINPGPSVTQFGVEPGWDRKYRDIKEKAPNGKPKLDKNGMPVKHKEEISKTRVKVERITALSNNLALALATPSIRIEAPIPGKSMIGIEVPNAVTSTVTMRGVIETAAFQKMQAKCKLAVGLGKAAGGEVVVADIAKMPHLLIAGATGSGKTACMNSIIGCLLMQNTPDELRFVLIDPKRVELTTFNNIPHLLTPVVVDPEEAVKALRRVIVEMDNRYKKFAAISVRNIEGYNKSTRVSSPFPNLVVVIDELADLMMTAPDVVEPSLCRLAQLARATGIHLIVATQRPSVDVVTGLIKANFPTRISFAVTSQVDSRTILDTVGAEKLLGRGDMLYMPTDAAKPKRLQGTFSSDPEMEKIVSFWVCQQPPGATADQVAKDFAAIDGDAPDDKDPALIKARQMAEDNTRMSASLLQRRLRIGYPRAARIMDVLREEGLVDSEEGEHEDLGPDDESDTR